MSVTKFASIGVAAAASAQLAITALLPSPPPITIHRLEYRGGVVVQEHSVRGAGEVELLTWAAQIIDHETGNAVPGCTGSGVWPFETGRRVAAMTLDQWVGSLGCVRGALADGTYHLRVAYSWGGGMATARSEVFEVTR